MAIALNGNTKIIATTIQKFPYIVDSVKGLKNKRFAVIIDEAHSSTAGKDMAAVTMSLGSGEQFDGDVEDMISDEIKRNGKQANVSMFAFTATPKPTTIQLFGRLNTKGQREAFHVYSMKQAIEEGFILDVLQNYTEYSTFYQINKEMSATQQRVDELKKVQAELEAERKRLDDLKYIEKLAREDHNMVGKNEVPLFIVDEQEKQQKQETEAEEKKK